MRKWFEQADETVASVGETCAAARADASSRRAALDARREECVAKMKSREAAEALETYPAVSMALATVDATLAAARGESEVCDVLLSNVAAIREEWDGGSGRGYDSEGVYTAVSLDVPASVDAAAAAEIREVLTPATISAAAHATTAAFTRRQGEEELLVRAVAECASADAAISAWRDEIDSSIAGLEARGAALASHREAAAKANATVAENKADLTAAETANTEAVARLVRAREAVIAVACGAPTVFFFFFFFFVFL
jgi:hypothetical protein